MRTDRLKDMAKLRIMGVFLLAFVWNAQDTKVEYKWK
jgi:hypothetical protein